MSKGNGDCKVYVGNLPSNIHHRDLEDVFYKYGSIVNVDLHLNKPTPFAFVEFEDARDAKDAIVGRDGYQLEGSRIRVEFPRNRERSSRGGNGYGRGRGFGGRGGGGGRNDFRSSKPRGYQLIVTGLPPTGSWQDLKDHFRTIGEVMFADVYKDGTGSVEFPRQDHMKRALRDLDDSKFRSHEGETSYIRVKEPRQNSYSPRRRSNSPYRSPSRSPPCHRSPSHSPPCHRRYRSRSRSRSRSWTRSRSR